MLIAPRTNPDHNIAANWRSSAASNGHPGSGDTTAYATWKTANGITDDLGDPDFDGLNNFGEFVLGTGHATASTAELPAARVLNVNGQDYRALDIRRSLASADAAAIVVETSTALTAWNADAVYVGEVNHGDGTATVTWRSVRSSATTAREFLRARFVLR